MKQIKRKKHIQAVYTNIYSLQKKTQLEELKIRKIIELRRDESVRKFKYKFGFNLKVKHIEILQ